jgi:hypothetical protein
MRNIGYVVIGGKRFSIEKIRLYGGEIEIIFTVPPGEEFEGPITIFGSDDRGCWQGRTIVFPDRDYSSVFTYGMRQEIVFGSDKKSYLEDLIRKED